MTDLANLYSSPAPVFSVAGRAEGRLGRDLLRLDIAEGVLGLRTMVAHFGAVAADTDGSDRYLSYLDGRILDLGTGIGVTIGPPDGERKIFTGVVSALEVCFEEGQVPYVSVFAEDALMRLRMTTRTATWTDHSDADVVTAIAGEHGLGAQTDVDGPSYPVIQQWEQSDLAFLRDRAQRLDAELWVDADDVVHLAGRERRPGPEIRLVQGGELIGLTARADVAHQRATVELRGWDHRSVEAVSHVAGDAVVAAEVGSGRTGVQVAAQLFPGSGIRRSRRDVLDRATAEAYANAEMLRRARGFVTVDGVTSGTPDLIPGAKLDLRRAGRPFEGAGYRVVHAHHSYDLTIGYRTRFRAERPSVSA
ncbi:phage late control D family protein [Actinoplanes sp. M2I2]|uniref:phage late control D family protein n=1 Tax=Actinoplanes sp. M2I2 TaxID=1734444 RepID=UPI00202097AC|nr:contractile injection system protein, VgrG/Pvc8 family [Actinoplanes sp. M2I2]